jgi:ribosomal protein S27AE
MSVASDKMICPRCGTRMNRHADKLVATMSPRDLADVDPDLGGVVEETHACRNCGNVEFRRARPRP